MPEVVRGGIEKIISIVFHIIYRELYMKKLIILLIFLYANHYSQWQKLNINTTEWLTSTYFINDSTGYVCGSNGIIIKTTDYGISWNQQDTKTKKTLRSIYFIDENIGIASGYMGIILRTTDSGTTWDIISDTTNYYELNSIHFIDKNYGWIVGGDYIFTSVMLNTTDGGKSWQHKSSITSNELISISPLNADTIYTLDFTGNLFKSTDRGQSWSLINDFNLASNAIYFNDNIGYIIGSASFVYKTTNNGQSWIKEEVNNNNDEHLFNISMIDNTVCLVGGHYTGFYGIILTSVDGGKNWVKDSVSKILWDVQFLNNKLGYAVGEYGCFYKYSTVTDVELYPHENIMNSDYLLSQNYPNPFNPTTTIEYEIPQQGNVQIIVYDILGRRIKELINEEKNTGNYFVIWNGKDNNDNNVSSGTYYYQIISGNNIQTKKMMIVK